MKTTNFSQQQVIEKLSSHGIRPSVQRIAVLSYLLHNRVHPTADEIYLSLSPSMPTLSKTTVYNVLKNFAECGVILALNIDEKNVRYDATTEEHSHLKCTSCGELYDIPQPRYEHVTLEGFVIDRVHMYCWGICPACLSNNINNKNNN